MRVRELRGRWSDLPAGGQTNCGIEVWLVAEASGSILLVVFSVRRVCFCLESLALYWNKDVIDALFRLSSRTVIWRKDSLNRLLIMHACEVLDSPLRSSRQLTISANDHLFPAEHDVSATFDSVDDRLSTKIEIIELRFRYAIVDIHRWNGQCLCATHLIETMDTCHWFFDNAFDSWE